MYRQGHAKPLLEQLHRWLNESLSQHSTWSPMAAAIGYAPTNWRAHNVYVDFGCIEIDNNMASRALRALRGLVLERVADHPINQVDDLLPWVVASQLGPPSKTP